MSSPQIPFNLIPTNPHFTDALNLLKRDIGLNLFCHQIGTVQSFNAAFQTCSVTINYPKTYFELNKATGLYSPVQVSYPVLLDCPAIVLGGGGGALSLPIQKGDECLVLFNDRDLDNWFQGGAGAAVATGRTHSFSDGLILVGLRSKANVLSTYDLVRACLRGGAGVVAVNTSNNKILLTNDSPTGSDGSYSYSTTVGSLLAQLVSQLQTMVGHVNSLVTQTAAITVASFGSPPVNAAAITAIGAQLSADSTNLGMTATSLAGVLE